jgi:hypothetical protein
MHDRIIRLMTERAEWLRAERLTGGNAEHLYAREEETRYMLARIINALATKEQDVTTDANVGTCHASHGLGR